jgi:cellulose biosynthesis protein BcsQ
MDKDLLSIQVKREQLAHQEQGYYSSKEGEIMGIVIGVCGAEKNTGVTSTSLFIGQALYEVTRQNVCVIDLDNDNPELQSILENDDINNYNIDNIMTYASVEGAKLESVIKSNSTPFLNSKLHVIYGTTYVNKKYTDLQITNLIQSVKTLYDYTIIDLGATTVPQNLVNNLDLFLVMCLPTEKYIKGLSERKDLLNKKTELVINHYSKVIGIDKFIRKNLNKEVFATLPFSKEVQINMNRGYLDFEGGAYQQHIYDMIHEILNRFSLKDKISVKFLFGNDLVDRISHNPIVEKLWGKKKDSKKLEERVKSANSIDKSPMLGELLVQKGYITREQLNEALHDQMV